MKKIIKGAYRKFVTDCQICGCRFEYDIDDVSASEFDVVCPDCGFCTPHYVDCGLESSRGEVESTD